MASKEVEVKLSYKEQGREQAQRGAEKLNQALGKAKPAEANFTALDKAMGRGVKQTAALASGLQRVNKLLKTMGEGSVVADLKKQLQDTTREVERLTAAKKRDEEADQRRKARRGFAMGVLQGAGVGEYFPEQGFRANVAGRAVGSFARRGLGSLASAPFTGIGGLAGAVGAFGPIGQAVAAQIQTAVASASEALGIRQQQFGMAHLLPGSSSAAVLAAGDAAARGVAIPRFDASLVSQARQRAEYETASRRGHFDEVVQAKRAVAMGQAGQGVRPARNTEERVMESRIREQLMSKMPELVAQAGSSAAAAATRVQHRAIQAAVGRRDAARETAEARVLNAPFRSIMETGVRFGMGPAQALQAATQFGGATGSRLDTTDRGQRRFQMALAAQSNYGVDLGVSGGIISGERSGALGGRSFEAVLKAALSTATRMGLTGEDRAEYLQQINARVQEFASTGMPVADESLNNMSRYLSQAVGGQRGAQLAGQLTRSLQGISSAGGPSSAVQMRAARIFGGLRPGSGAEGLAEAMEKLENLSPEDLTPDKLEEFLGGPEGYALGPGARKLSAQYSLSELFGSRVTMGEASRLLGNPDALSAKFRDQMAVGQREAQQGEGLMDVAAPGALQASAGVQLSRYLASGKLIQSMLETERIQANNLHNVAQFSEYLNGASKFAREASDTFRNVVKDFREVVDGMMDRMGLAKTGGHQ